jgi:type II secretory pathway pseudopilin PulG
VKNVCHYKKVTGQRGISLIENLVAVGLMAIIMAASSRLMIVTMHANEAARSHASILSDVQQIVDTYRAGNYGVLLGKFGGDYTTIANGTTVEETVTAPHSHATYTVRFTAFKASSVAIPEAIQVRVTAQHRKGKLGVSDYVYETVVAQVG